MELTPLYINDTIGLRALDERGDVLRLRLAPDPGGVAAGTGWFHVRILGARGRDRATLRRRGRARFGLGALACRTNVHHPRSRHR